jgi:GNAT superfamily N-acetyltransferase
MTLNSVKTKPVEQTNWTDFENLFESKGAPGYCWCMAWRMTTEELKSNTSSNRKLFIKKRVDKGTPVGLLFYHEEKPVAWCSVAPRNTYQRLKGDESLENVWSIACFYIKRDFRDKGLIHKMIKSAEIYAKENGADFLEAYPVRPESPSYRFMGFIGTFEKAGFEFVKMAGSRRHVMTKRI